MTVTRRENLATKLLFILTLCFSLFVSGCSTFVVRPEDSGGGSGSDDAEKAILMVLLVGAWGLWHEKHDGEVEVPAKPDPQSLVSNLEAHP